ncbi:MAG: nitroreductase family protein [Chloroflexota bacterium]|nr:nitroreductase family protein [Chloroflexota bacterium]
MDLVEAIRDRRSIRKYKTDPVSEKDLNTLLEAARWAPSWANTQCVRWVVVKDPGLRAQLAETLPGANPAYNAMKVVPVVLVACAVTGKAGFKKGEPTTDKGDWFLFDVALAAQNLTLAAHAIGLGTVHVGLMDAGKAEEILGVPEGVRVVEFIPLGYPDESPNGPGRNELSEIVFHEKYGQS